MYYQLISQCTRSLKTTEVWLDRAEQYAAAKQFDVGCPDGEPSRT